MEENAIYQEAKTGIYILGKPYYNTNGVTANTETDMWIF